MQDPRCRSGSDGHLRRGVRSTYSVSPHTEAADGDDPRRFDPKLNKKRVLTHAEYTVYSVNGLAVRNVAQPDEEFGNFATPDEFPDLIPRRGDLDLGKARRARRASSSSPTP